ncbi:hypothetical protein [Alkalihalobacillus sp. R86527]|uniref:hypothetical protein n=1 Tax=Alkalihalobacillus sp. R86527 TaxID=3093863 RepID=UPI00366F909E
MKHPKVKTLLRKLMVGFVTAIIVPMVLVGLSIDSSGEFIAEFMYMFPYFFYGVFLYGIWASLLSDSLARSMAYTMKKPEPIISLILHVLAGAIFGMVSFIPAITFFVLDRLFQKRSKVHNQVA